MKLRYGETSLRLTLPTAWEKRVQIFDSTQLETACPGQSAGNRRAPSSIVQESINAPLGCPPFEDTFHTNERVAIVTSDITRPMPSHLILPEVVERLLRCGIEPHDITVVFARGIHRAQTAAERRQLAGTGIPEAVHLVDSDPSDTIHIGHTAGGTPVNISRTVAGADRIILLGNVEYHYFAGYTGGYKALLPGVCDQETVTHNHRLMTDPRARAGVLEDNPVRADIDSMGDLLQADFIVNVVLDDDGGIRAAFSGHPITAHRAAVAEVDRVKKRGIREKGAAVIASAGGHPKDIDLYQAQKSLEFAAGYVRKGAPIILVAACGEGYGHPVMERWFSEATEAREVLQRLEEQFELGGHKAAMIARVINTNPTWLVSEMPDQWVRRAFLHPAPHENLHCDLAKLCPVDIDRSGPVYVLPNAAAYLVDCASGVGES